MGCGVWSVECLMRWRHCSGWSWTRTDCGQSRQPSSVVSAASDICEWHVDMCECAQLMMVMMLCFCDVLNRFIDDVVMTTGFCEVLNKYIHSFSQYRQYYKNFLIYATEVCYLTTTFQCPSDILITSWLFTARWSTWPGNHLVPYVAELVGSCILIHARRCLPDPKCLFYPSGLSLYLSVDHLGISDSAW